MCERRKGDELQVGTPVRAAENSYCSSQLMVSLHKQHCELFSNVVFKDGLKTENSVFPLTQRKTFKQRHTHSET